MDFSLQSLLRDAVARAHITKQVGASQVVEAANNFLLTMPGQIKDKRAVAYRNNVLTIHCLNSPAGYHLRAANDTLMTEIKRALPGCDLKEIQVQIVARFKER